MTGECAAMAGEDEDRLKIVLDQTERAQERAEQRRPGRPEQVTHGGDGRLVSCAGNPLHKL